jgi:hypothetical protein
MRLKIRIIKVKIGPHHPKVKKGRSYEYILILYKINNNI